MKILFPLLLLMFFSNCHQAREQKSIEIMSYNYEWSGDNLVPNFILYATIHPDGKVEILRKKQYQSGEVIGYNSVVDKRTVDSIFKLASDFDEIYYQPVYDTTTINICDAPLVRIKVSTSKKEDYSLTFSECNKEPKYIAYKRLYKQLHNNIEKQRTTENQRALLLQKQESYERFVIHKDSTQLVFPPPPPAPKIDEVKFIQPQ